MVNTDKLEQLSDWQEALAHPIRLHIIKILLKQSECGCGELVNQLPISQSTVSQHLKKLKKAGFIEGKIDPPKVCYRLNKKVIQQYKKLLTEELF